MGLAVLLLALGLGGMSPTPPMAGSGTYQLEPTKTKKSETGPAEAMKPEERSPDASSSPAIESGHAAAASLENTRWKLVRLGGTPVTEQSPEEPHLLLDSKTRRVSGSGGCNHLTGGYEVAGDRLTLRQVAGTRMACPSGMETEKRFLDALKQVRRWKINAGQLLFSDAAGKAVAALEAGRTAGK